MFTPRDEYTMGVLAAFIDILNERGPDSEEARAFRATYSQDEEITLLLNTALETREWMRSEGDS